MKNINRTVYNPPLLRIFSIAAIIYFVYYLLWRAIVTLNPAYPFFSWLLWSAEAFGVFTYILFTWQTQDISPSRPFVKAPTGKKVDVFVPTFNESMEILEATLIGCQKINYPHTTYVLDDGDRQEVRALAERLGCSYIARPSHEHAKAGNINYALKKTEGEFIIFLDADMVPQPDYIDRTLGYFSDPKLALIQLPQEFYNLDSIQHSRKQTTWHEQSLFFRIIQPGKNYSNSAFWCGSPSIVRRSALEEVGGVATETVTEDIHTSVRLHSHGWSTLFVNEILAYGIAPQTIKAFLVQRLRWAQGTMQLYRSKESPLWVKGLTLKQRLSYLSSFLAYLESFQKFILITIPILILGFGVLPMRVNFLDFIFHWSIYFGLNILANQLGGRGVFHYLKTEKFNLLKTIIFMQSTLTLFTTKPLNFKVTPKTIEDNVYKQERQSMRGFMVILGTLVGAMAYSITRLVTNQISPYSAELMIIAFFWAIYNSLIIILALEEIFSKKHQRKQYRFPVHIPGRIFIGEDPKQYVNVEINDLSLSGASLKVQTDFFNYPEKFYLQALPRDFENITIPIERLFLHQKYDDQSLHIGVSFCPDLGLQREILFAYLFIHLPATNAEIIYKINTWDPFRTLQREYQ